MSDNRNGTRRVSNADVFLFKSTNGGSTWTDPTRVNNDPSAQPPNRNCHRQQPGGVTNCPTTNFGADQWFPWVDIGPRGDVNVVFYDRRLDRNSTAHEWPGSRTTPGDYLTWFWGANCDVDRPDSSECVAAGLNPLPQPTAAVDPGNELFPAQTSFPYRNFGISDVPSNMDYSFGAGTFIGDYNNVAIGPDNEAYGFWTDTRNGRSSRIGGASAQPGRNPICEQADAWVDEWYAGGRPSGQNSPRSRDALFLVTPCPAEAADRENDRDDEDDD